MGRGTRVKAQHMATPGEASGGGGDGKGGGIQGLKGKWGGGERRRGKWEARQFGQEVDGLITAAGQLRSNSFS